MATIGISADLVANEVLSRGERGRNGSGPTAIVVHKLAHAPCSRWEVARDKARFVDLELQGVC